MQKFVLGIDCGTTLSKCVLFDLEGNVIAIEKNEYGIYQEREGWAEQDADWWWNASVINVRNILEKTKIDSKSIAGIGVDSQREAFVPLDSEGKKLWNSVTWLDKRTMPLAEEIKKVFPADELRERTGGHIDHVVSAPKIIWLRRNKPEIFRKAVKIVFSKDYIAFRLTNKTATDYSMASRTRLFNIKKRVWDEDICDALDIPISILPDVQGAWDIVGGVTKEASKITGLAEGTPVVSGGGDRPCESLGSGVITPGQMNIGSGTGTAFEVPLSEPHLDYKDRIDCCCHVVPDTWEYEAGLLSGACLRWFRDQFGYEEVEKAKMKNGDPYHYLDELAEKVNEGSDMLFCYPYFMGAGPPVYEFQAKAVYFGFTLWHGKPHFVRSLLEGLAFQYVGIIDLLNELGVKVNNASMSGGESRSRVWNQIKADVIGMNIRIPVVEDAAAALGSAILAGVGSGIYKNVAEGVKRCIRFRDVYQPRADHHENYVRLFDKYKKVYESISKAYNIVA